MNEVLDVTFVSVWDGGYEIETSAKFDVKNKTVFDIEVAEGIDEEGDEVQTLDEQYVLLPSGEKFRVEEHNGEYLTFPPLMHFKGVISDIQAFIHKLDDLKLEEPEIEVYSSHAEELKIEPMTEHDYTVIEDAAKTYGLTLKQ